MINRVERQYHLSLSISQSWPKSLLWPRVGTTGFLAQDDIWCAGVRLSVIAAWHNKFSIQPNNGFDFSYTNPVGKHYLTDNL
jgi:hypothetical protein